MGQRKTIKDKQAVARTLRDIGFGRQFHTFSKQSKDNR
jgi:hypothetical protein